MPIIMGFDPAKTRNLGVSIVDYNLSSGEMNLLDRLTFVFEFENGDQDKRLVDAKNMIEEKIEKYNVSVMCSEKVPLRGFAKTLKDMNELMGVVKMIAREKEIDFFEYFPTSMKLEVAGHGQSSKEEVQNALVKIFDLKQKEMIPLGRKNKKMLYFSSDHESDAIASVVTCIKRELKKE